ncbi:MULTISPECIES: glutaminyl-peptide cyclotransferase [unclassified Duganella]|uniref:glutaminyl-peptide cyclotransferase n=1 Tax=unclassified Duganella TaxID=2636909 RepID=UPI0008813D5F|nr:MULTISPECIES: glutaminyl-peptide cyclotransferase [unclassified Duganella]SDH38405.1 Glutamine cyclotransferase [Duganella sp. OV458]SDK74001.1 Glutamine cyclotransferase [Duganella sp. OV510]
MNKIYAQALLLASLLPAAAVQAALPTYDYKVVRSYPHDTQAFTEGLLYRDGFLYESTGLNGKSSIRKVDLASGKILQSKDIPPQYFGEGLTDWGDTLVGLTWQTQTGFVFDLKTFEMKSQFAYPGEGWGLTHNGKELIMSDGTATLRFLDPKTFLEVRRVKVTADGIAVNQLNELEVVEGEIFANIWHTSTIARIDPASGKITGWIDFGKLYPDAGKGQNGENVMNGIAYDPVKKRLFVTGKLWPKIYEVNIVPRK